MLPGFLRAPAGFAGLFALFASSGRATESDERGRGRLEDAAIRFRSSCGVSMRAAFKYIKMENSSARANILECSYFLNVRCYWDLKIRFVMFVYL